MDWHGKKGGRWLWRSKFSIRGILAKLSAFWKEFKEDAKNPPYIAMSNAVGVLCMLIPTFGQWYACFLLWIAMRRCKCLNFSLTVAVAWTLLSNPLTLPFMAYSYYMLGCSAMNERAQSFDGFARRLKEIFDERGQLCEILKNEIGFLADDIGLQMFVGYAASSAILVPICYLLSYWIAKKSFAILLRS